MDPKASKGQKKPANASKKQGKPSGKSTKGPSGIAKRAAEARIQAELEEELRLKEEQELKLKEEEEEKKRQEEERLKKEEAEKLRKERKEKKLELKRLGLWKTPSQLEHEQRDARAREQFINLKLVNPESADHPHSLPTKKKKIKPKEIPHTEEIVEEVVEIVEPVKEAPAENNDIVENWDDEQDEDSDKTLDACKKIVVQEKPKEETRKKMKNNEKIQNPEFKSPIVCVLGHVDTGKTKLLDKIRHTNVQVGEAGGITQQIGATMFPADAINLLTTKLPNLSIIIQVPGLLIIDTPGHESFSNLRSRGSSLCDLGILVVDIMHGLEKQTLESLEILRKKNIPFIVALNKIDRMYGWKSVPNEAFITTFKQQESHTQDEFIRRAKETVLAFAEKGLNAALYYENPDPEDYINLVPTSAITGEGLPDLLGMLVNISQTTLSHKIKFRPQLQATVMEVKVIEGLGTTIDVILANGILKEDDNFVIAGFNGPIVSNIRALLTPMPMKEMRVKGEYLHHKMLYGSMGAKISAHGLEEAMAGSPLFVSSSPDDIPSLCEEVQKDVAQVFSYINKKGKGVHVQASTVGSLEALLEFLKESKIPVCSVSIGPVYKKDIMKAQGQIEKLKRREYATVLAFDVKVTPEGQEYAEQVGVKIFAADIIYHLFDRFTEYVKQIRDEEKAAEGKGKDAVFPCVLKIVQVFRVKDPIIIGVDVLGGVVKIGTPLCIPEKGNLIIGKVQSIEFNKKPLNEAKTSTGSVAIKIAHMNSDQQSIQVGKQFEETNQVASWITRDSIDALKEYFMDQMTMDDWKLAKVLKTTYGIV
jgi:translation initiation factor 5B